MGDDYGEATLTLEDGTTIKNWQEYSVNSEFMTPTDGWNFSFTTKKEWDRIRGLVDTDRKIELRVDGNLQLTGWVDEVKVACGGNEGLTVQVQGRDVLKVLCDANIHPDTVLKKKTIDEVVDFTLKWLYQKNKPTLFFDNNSNRDILTGVKGFKTGKKKHKLKTELEWCSAKPNEGAFEFLARNLRRFGLWMWARADGNVVLGSPDYDQDPSYSIIHRDGYKGRVKVLHASLSKRDTQSPSHVQVKGKCAAKEWMKKTVTGFIEDKSRRLYVPRYVLHEQATTKEEAQAFAEQEMSEARKDSYVYECTLRGHTDADSGKTYAVDTVAHVEDDILGVHHDLWVKERTFQRSVHGGTTTQLKCVPLGSITFSDLDHPT